MFTERAQKSYEFNAGKFPVFTSQIPNAHYFCCLHIFAS